MINEILFAAFSLFIIMDPFASIPYALQIIKKCKNPKEVATVSVSTAALLAFLFLFTGVGVLDILYISFSDFKIGGGIVLVLLGIQNVLGILTPEHKKSKDIHTAIVLIGIPLLAGPGLVTNIIVLAEIYGVLIVGTGLVVSLLASWLIIYKSTFLIKILGETGIMILSKVIGLILLALGISYIRGGLI
ncbi:MarC family protein [Candidatus Micrarchaeota archaeon]|nr:MarC family protein [Candidatus Micrarchaeota archaeon]